MDNADFERVEEMILKLGDAVRDSFAGDDSDCPYFSQIIEQLNNLSESICPAGACGRDASGGTVGSITEAVMGATGGLHAIARAIADVSSSLDAIEAGLRQ